jgi:enterochelin esterase-like enzyme
VEAVGAKAIHDYAGAGGGLSVRASVTLFLAVACVLSLACAQPATAERPIRSPEVIHTGKAPTGYTVTFRYLNPNAKKVQIKGEWYFARPSGMAQVTPAPGFPVFEGQGILPKDWQPGDFPLVKFDPKDPYSLGGNWPVTDMTKDKDGVWTYTTPLPSGVFTYGFLVDCADPCKTGTGIGVTTISDPNNRPWNETKDGVVDGSIQRNSQVYVPSDPNFDTVDYSWEGPATHKGKLTHITYSSPGHIAPKDTNYIVVYTPPDYDPARAKLYPTLYVSHGWGAAYEMNWSTEAVAGNILDNLIDTGQIEPMVAVMGPKEDGFDDAGDPPGGLRYFERRERDLIDNVMPYVEKHYHVSTSPMDRAFTGGGGATIAFFLNHPEAFQYYGAVGAGLPKGNETLTPDQIAALKGKSISIGGGWQDPTFTGFPPAHTGVDKEVTAFAKAGIPVTTDFVNGGHEYSVFRVTFKDFLTRVAFLPRPYEAW